MLTAATYSDRQPGGPPIFLYEQTDVPEGRTLDQWRVARARERRAAERESHRRFRRVLRLH
jgi:hypothetical protein